MNPLHAVERNRVGRPLVKPGLKVKQHSIWLHRPVVDRIIALVGTQGLSGFMRDAAEKELIRREKAATKLQSLADDNENCEVRR